MKKHRFIFVFVFVALAIIAAISIYIMVNKDNLIYTFMLYDNIEYNGIDYYQAESKFSRPSNTFLSEQVPVYLVSKSKVDYKHVYYASVYTGYEGEDEEIFLFFDSCLYVRGDYMTETTNTTNEFTTTSAQTS